MYYKKQKTSFKLPILFIFLLSTLILITSLLSSKANNGLSIIKNLICVIDREIKYLENNNFKNSITTEKDMLRLDTLKNVRLSLENELNLKNNSNLAKELNNISNLVEDIITFGYSYIGYPYKLGAIGPDSFDCSSFIQHILGNFNINLPRLTYDQVNIGKSISYNKLKIGDLIFTEGTKSKPEHVGIYIGCGKMLHAANPKDGILISPIYNFKTARRVI